MLYGALDVDPLAIEEVEVQYEPLAFPMINRIIRVEYGLTRAVERPALAYEGKVLRRRSRRNRFRDFCLTP